MSGWVAYCADADREAVARLAVSLHDGSVQHTNSADELRRRLLEAEPGSLGAIVGEVAGGVLDVNLAAAIADDGSAREVVLALRDAPGPLRARAARAGVSKVVDLADFDPAPELIRPSFAKPARGPGGPIVAFCSGRGGEGKTSVVAVAAAAAANWGMSVCAIDLDLCCGNLYSCFGLAQGTDLARLSDPGADAQELVRGLMHPLRAGLELCGPCNLPEEAELVSPHVGALLNQAAADHDLVLVDCSTTFTDAVAQAAQAADRLVLVSDGRPGSLASLARVSGLSVRLGVARMRIAQLQNRADPRAKVDYSFGRAEVGLEAARIFRAFESGLEVEDYLGAGQALALAESGSPFAESVGTMLAQILVELGRLPQNEAAERAARGSATKRRSRFFKRRAEAS